MRFNPSYIFTSVQKKRENLISYAMRDKFFAEIVHDLTDFGHDITFSLWGGAGAYMPFALSTEKIDTPEKQQQFASGFWAMVEAGNMKAKMRFSTLLGAEANVHYFLHELMHFYQDMHGLYLLPLQEQGYFPTLLDAKSDIIAILFCEAWAEIEAIRSSWALREKGYDSGWKGAMSSPDWKDLAVYYDEDMQKGLDEKCVAAKTFHRWYEGEHRGFYERHALKIHEANFARFKEGLEFLKDEDIVQNLRTLELPMLLARLPQGGIPKFFHQIDWENHEYSQVKTRGVLERVQELEGRYGRADNPNIQDIKCGAPPYLWNRLRIEAKNTSEIPPH